MNAFKILFLFIIIISLQITTILLCYHFIEDFDSVMLVSVPFWAFEFYLGYKLADHLK